MDVILTTDYQRNIYTLRLKHPDWTQKKIAEMLNVSQALVSKVDRKRSYASLIQVPDKIRKRAYQSMNETADSLEMYLSELEELKSKQKQIVIMGDKGKKSTTTIDQTPTEKSNLIKMQIDTRIKLNELRTLEEPMKILDWIGGHGLPEVTK